LIAVLLAVVHLECTNLLKSCLQIDSYYLGNICALAVSLLLGYPTYENYGSSY